MSEETIKAALAHGITADYAEDWAERSAILEMDGGYTRKQADILAAQQLIAEIPAAKYTAKIHYLKEGKAACGSFVKRENLTNNAKKVTCQRCAKKAA